MGWFSRWRERQKELAAGVDADLIEENRKRRNLALALLVCALLLVAIQATMKLSGMASEIAVALTITCFLGSFVLGRWGGPNTSFCTAPIARNRPHYVSFVPAVRLHEPISGTIAHAQDAVLRDTRSAVVSGISAR
jgi:hypothetical protein